MSQKQTTYLTTGKAAKHCGVRINTIKRWIQQGRIPAVQTPGGHWRIPGDEFEQFMSQYAQLDAASAHPIMGQAPCNILVIEDDPVMCELVKDALEMLETPCEVHVAHDGYSGLVQAGLLLPDVLVLDIMLPEIDGTEVIRRLKSIPELREKTAIVVLTGHPDRNQVQQDLRGVRPDAVMFKPVDMHTLVQTVQSLLERSVSLGRVQYAD